MAKLSKAEGKLHAEAQKLLQKDELTFDDKWFVYENWREDANHVNSLAGAFFTPINLANDFAIEIQGMKVLDLCAGIGVLSFCHNNRASWERVNFDITCVELNQDYVEVGKKLLPTAKWIHGDVFDVLDMDLGRFDVVISNPPFGSTPSRNKRKGPNYTGNRFEYHVIDIGMQLADYGVFIVPQNSAPFRYSGQRDYREDKSKEYLEFAAQTKLELHASCGIDTSVHRDQWHGVSPATEIVIAEKVT
jgi:phospholipid N-methyltransferase